MKNMGLSRLLVSEAPPFQDEAMKMMSTHAAADIIDGMRCFSDLGTPWRIFSTSSAPRPGWVRPGAGGLPRDMAPRIVEIARNNEVPSCSVRRTRASPTTTSAIATPS
jgi:hypothetical protein